MKIFGTMALAIAMIFSASAVVPTTAAQAASVVVTSTVTGGPGSYTHTFTLTNNIGGTNDIYFFGVDLAGSIIGTPLAWADSGNQNADWTNSSYGGSSTVYPNTWCCSLGGTPSGTTTSGFQILSTLNPSTINFFVYASGGSYSGSDAFYTGSNPGFEGLVNSQAGAVPEPAAWAMLLLGFGIVGSGVRSRRKQGMTVTCA